MDMEARMFKAYAKGDEKIQLKIISGHFITSQSHITHYLDMTTMKTRCAEAAQIARLLSAKYEATTPVDSIILSGRIGSCRLPFWQRTGQSRCFIHECAQDHLHCNTGISCQWANAFRIIRKTW